MNRKMQVEWMDKNDNRLVAYLRPTTSPDGRGSFRRFFRPVIYSLLQK